MANTLEGFFRARLKSAIAEGYDHTKIDHLAGCTERKLVLTEAEGEAGKLTFKEFMAHQLGGEWDSKGGWMFGSPETMRNIGLVPNELAEQRLGLNHPNWHLYHQIY